MISWQQASLMPPTNSDRSKGNLRVIRSYDRCCATNPTSHTWDTAASTHHRDLRDNRTNSALCGLHYATAIHSQP